MLGYREWAPSLALRPYVAACWFWAGDGPPVSYRVLPDGCIDIIYSIQRHPGSDSHQLTLVGTMTRFLDVSRSEVPLTLGVRFRPAGAVPFLGCPASEITDLSLPLEEIWGDDANRLLARLVDGDSVSSRFAVLEEALRARLTRRGGENGDPQVMRAAARITGDPSCLNLPDLASQVDLSPRQLRRRFENVVGVGPKRLGRILRFQNVLRTVTERQSKEWAGVALDAGYYDQVHMIGDFREFTGLSPTRYLASR